MEDASTLVDCLIGLGYISLFSRDHLKAKALGEEAVMLSRERGYTADLARALNCLGWARLLEGDHERARDSYAQSLAMYTELGNGAIAAESLEGLACAAGPRGDAGRSASLFGAAEAAGYHNVPARGALREPYLAAARSLVDDATWRAAYAEGRSTDIKETISRALEEARNRSEGH